MADPATYRPRPGSIPDSPGVYRFSDVHGRVIYVGKAKSLRARLNSYFQDIAALHVRTQTMVQTAAKVDWTVVGTEVEALQLEYSWIKEFDPRFNVRYRDDKSYPSLAVTLNEEFPRLQVMRGPKKRGVRYFGPYAHAWAIRETLDLLLRVFPARTCSAGVFKRAGQVGRPCLLGYIGKCSAPCVGRVSPAEHRRIVEDFCDFMAGQTATYLRRLEKEMQAAAAVQEYERAARLRDDIGALKRAMEKNAVVLGDGTDADVIALAEDQLEAAVQVFHVRGGRVRGQRGFVVDKVEDVTTGDLVEHFLQQLYGDDTDPASAEGAGDGEAVPREVLVPELPADAAAVTEWLSSKRGARVDLRVPQRGDKRALMETVARNATQSLALHKTKRASDLTTRSLALQEIQNALELDEAPLRIECFDVSNLQGTEVVASMVVFEDGLARKSEYRTFNIKGVEGQNDVAAIAEVITRRFRRHLDDRVAAAEDRHSGPIDPDTGKPRRFAYRPNLVVVDGGPPQVAAAAEALEALHIYDIEICGLAKRLEEVWLPGQADPVILPRTSEGLYLLQRVRDEAHRFAITHHRKRRSKSMIDSTLDAIPGLGDVRRKALMKHFGSVRKLRAATAEEIAAVPGFGPRTAQAVVDALAATGGAPAVNMATGEIIEETSSGPGSAPATAGGGQG
ncbi:excinuclease ABC subunit UvrC [Sporichthya polymorpha]|uniref:excinuclease ABC subunit UvrC n=1 Tax=Sporichthya polymorpha TaxID=35751 RepID=UPI000379068D|nr:excinuclease ABC subunit UvrC [Sporichthya polymorpha]